MKLQYIFHFSMAHSSVSVYCDGWLVEKKIFWSEWEANEYMNQLDEEGYEHAYTDEDVELAKEQYEYVLEHRLMKKEK